MEETTGPIFNTDDFEIEELGTGDDGRYDDYNDFSDTGSAFEKPLGADTVYGEDFGRLQGLERDSSRGGGGSRRRGNARQFDRERGSDFEEDQLPVDLVPNASVGGASNSIDWGYNKVTNFQPARDFNRERRGVIFGGRKQFNRGGGEIAGTGRGGHARVINQRLDGDATPHRSQRPRTTKFFRGRKI